MPEYLIFAEATQGNIAEIYTTLKNMENKKNTQFYLSFLTFSLYFLNWNYWEMQKQI